DAQGSPGRPAAGTVPPGSLRASRRARRRSAVALSRSLSAPPAYSRRGQAPVPDGEPDTAAPADCRGPSLDRHRDPGAPRQRGREPSVRPRAPRGDVTAGLPERLGRQGLLRPGPLAYAVASRRGPATPSLV